MDAKTDELIQEFVAAGGRAEEWRPAYSIAPTEAAPIVREHTTDDGEIHRELEIARWDWEKPAKMAPSRAIFNARIEKLVAGSWTAAFSSSRCIVPMRGYYEWTGEGGKKIPHFLHSDGLLAAAGLTWHMPVDGESTRCFVVITREARDASGAVHDRMPAFLTRNMWDEWLNPASLTVKGDTAASRKSREALLDDLIEASDDVASHIREYIVDRHVNNSRTVDPHDPGLIEPTES